MTKVPLTKQAEEHPLDSVVHALCHHEDLLRQVSDDIRAADFVGAGDSQCAVLRAQVAMGAIKYYREHGRPIGDLLSAKTILPYCRIKESQETRLAEYVRALKVRPHSDAQAAADALLEHRSQRQSQEKAVERIITAYEKGRLTAELLRDAADQIRKPAQTAPPQIISAANLLKKRIEQPQFVVQGVLPSPALTMLAGKKGEGKTTLALALAISIVRGTDFLGCAVQTPGPVLMATLEDSEADLQNKVERITRGDSHQLTTLKLLRELPKLPMAASIIEQHLRERQKSGKSPYVAVIIDPFLAIAPERRGQMDIARSDYAEGYRLKQIATEFGVAVILNCHSPKSLWNDKRDRVMGTTGFIAPADALWILGRDQHEGDHRQLSISGRSIREQTMRLAMAEEGFTVLDTGAEAKAGPEAKAILKLLKESGPMTPREIAEALGKKSNPVYQLLYRLNDQNRVTKKAGKYVYQPEGS